MVRHWADTCCGVYCLGCISLSQNSICWNIAAFKPKIYEEWLAALLEISPVPVFKEIRLCMKCPYLDAQAAPFVAGVAAVFLADNPQATPAEVKAAIMQVRHSARCQPS